VHRTCPLRVGAVVPAVSFGPSFSNTHLEIVQVITFKYAVERGESGPLHGLGWTKGRLSITYRPAAVLAIRSDENKPSDRSLIC